MIKFKLSFNETNSILFTTYLSIYMYMRGVFFMTASKKTINTSDWYKKLIEIVDIELLGSVLLVAAVALLFSAFFKSKRSYAVFAFSNLVATIIYTFFSAAGVDYGINWFTPFMNLLNANFHLLLSGLGVWQICKMKKEQTL